MLTDHEIKELAHAHTGDDFETVCWAAAAEIKWLRERCKHFEKGIDELLMVALDQEDTADVLYALLQNAPQETSI